MHATCSRIRGSSSSDRIAGDLSCSVTLGKKGDPFWGRPFLVGQPPKKKEKKGATQQLRIAIQDLGGVFSFFSVLDAQKPSKANQKGPHTPLKPAEISVQSESTFLPVGFPFWGSPFVRVAPQKVISFDFWVVFVHPKRESPLSTQKGQNRTSPKHLKRKSLY